MPKKKKPSAEERRQEKIRSRIAAAEAKRPKSDPVPDMAPEPAPPRVESHIENHVENAAKPDPVPEPIRTVKPPVQEPVTDGPLSVRKKSAARRAPVYTARDVQGKSPMRLEPITTSPGEYEGILPPLASLSVLFDAIRDRQDSHAGGVYIRLDSADVDAEGPHLSYTYADGIFSRTDKTSRKKDPLALADVLDVPVRRIRAAQSPGRMDYYVNAYSFAAPGHTEAAT